jgi:hypothetical protein
MLTNWKTFAVVLAVATSSSAFAKLPPIPLECGKVPGFKSETKLQYMGQGFYGGDTYTVDLIYIGKKPTAKQLDVAMRDCLVVAAKKDGSKDILAIAWYRKREGADPFDDEVLNPHGAKNYISYVASTKSVEVRSLKKMK